MDCTSSSVSTSRDFQVCKICEWVWGSVVIVVKDSITSCVTIAIAEVSKNNNRIVLVDIGIIAGM